MSDAPAWLDHYTTTSGLPDPRLSGVTARPRHCTCGRLTLAGYDSPLIAGLAIVDPYALSPRHEAAAVILDVATFRLWGSPGHFELCPRFSPGHAPEATLAPASDDVVVVAEHRCSRQPLSTVALRTKGESSYTYTGEVPF